MVHSLIDKRMLINLYPGIYLSNSGGTDFILLNKESFNYIIKNWSQLDFQSGCCPEAAGKRYDCSTCDSSSKVWVQLLNTILLISRTSEYFNLLSSAAQSTSNVSLAACHLQTTTCEARSGNASALCSSCFVPIEYTDSCPDACSLVLMLPETPHS